MHKGDTETVVLFTKLRKGVQALSSSYFAGALANEIHLDYTQAYISPRTDSSLGEDMFRLVGLLRVMHVILSVIR